MRRESLKPPDPPNLLASYVLFRNPNKISTVSPCASSSFWMIQSLVWLSLFFKFSKYVNYLEQFMSLTFYGFVSISNLLILSLSLFDCLQFKEGLRVLSSWFSLELYTMLFFRVSLGGSQFRGSQIMFLGFQLFTNSFLSQNYSPICPFFLGHFLKSGVSCFPLLSSHPFSPQIFSFLARAS